MQHSAQCACTTGVGGGEPRVGRGRSTGPSASWKCHRPPGRSHCPRLPCGTHTHCCYRRFNACSRFRPQLYCTQENSREAFLLIFLDVGHLKLPGYLHNSKASGQGGMRGVHLHRRMAKQRLHHERQAGGGGGSRGHPSPGTLAARPACRAQWWWSLLRPQQHRPAPGGAGPS